MFYRYTVKNFIPSTLDLILFISFFISFIFIISPMGYFRLISPLIIILAYFLSQIYKINHKLYKSSCLESILIFIVFLIISAFCNSVYWLYSIDYILTNVHAPFGTIETGRYVNIAQYIINYDSLPKIKQNYGQSIISSFLKIFFNINLPLSLFILLAVSKALFLKLLYSIARINNGPFFSFILCILAFFVAHSLFFFPVLNYDSGNPIALNGYFDAIYSFLTLFLYVYINIIENKQSLFLNIILYSSWLITAPQNLILAIVYHALSFRISNFSQSFLGLITPAILIILGFFLGGFFLGSSDPATLNAIPGLDILLTKFTLSFNFGLDFLRFSPIVYPDFSFTHVSVSPLIFTPSFYELPIAFLSRLITIVSNNFLDLYVLFIFCFNKNFIKFKEIKTIYLASFIVFIATCFIEITGYKWQMSRFIMPFHIITTFIFFYYLSILNKRSLEFIINFILLLLLSYVNFYAFTLRSFLFFSNTPLGLFHKLQSGF
jgi:hypothetical protein